MEFRNHQIRIGHTLAQFRGNPLALVLLLLLVPVAIAVVVVVGLVAVAGIIVIRIAQGIAGALLGRPAASPREPMPFPFGGAGRVERDATPPSPPTASGPIDVEVVRRSDES